MTMRLITVESTSLLVREFYARWSVACNSLEDRKSDMIIPWEVDPKQIQHTSQGFLMVMAASCCK